MIFATVNFLQLPQRNTYIGSRCNMMKTEASECKPNGLRAAGMKLE
jgi:hypothetical protein